MSTEDRRNVVAINAYLENQGMSLEEEVALDNDVEDELCRLVDDNLLDVTSDYFIDAILDCQDEWADMVRAFPSTDRDYNINTALAESLMLNKAVERFTDSMICKLRKKLRVTAEEAVR